MGLKVAVVGSRNFANANIIYRALRRLMVLHPDGIEVISGGARGADSIGELAAKNLSLPTTIHLPDWDRYGKSAGFRRNMLIVEDADLVLAFFADGPRSKGTSHTVTEARIKGKPVHVYHEGKWS